MATETVTIPKEEYESLKKKAELDEELLVSLVKGLEDIKAGRIKPWEKATN
jgi:PHD/YefM family antitoxin component YafN of YafNO toxin-antitoxin module|tara:strand:+ start:186 stop:338 length:153 start_codon:yes stop_codon:yes gene_type:complete